MKLLSKPFALAAAAALAAPMLGIGVSSASAATRDGACNDGEFCYYYNSDQAGSVSDFGGSIGDYGTTQPDCYDFKGAGNGKGVCVKNNAASVWNRSSKTVRVYYNSNYAGSYQDIPGGTKRNLNTTLKNNNASHQFISTSTESCKNSFGNPRTCAEAVTWAKNHITTSYHSEYVGMCDHVMGLAYGWAHSGSSTAYVHWTQIPTSYRHGGDRSVPAGGLAFFSGGSSGAGHVMISIGGGDFISTDINGTGTLTKTTIGAIESRWGQHYLGWAQPWFKANH
ncbi:peptidase inhibitor family I36 protein [Phycicoccus sp. Soil748]|uniref:peptidase inhibitor family I36 protein n=1 Tax=Intrasporangiaceae TaxID=85021 RepID=UPI000A91E736|nr:peptidase inhibitor family I36 protein [Phycicoccus sp. Soil748]